MPIATIAVDAKPLQRIEFACSTNRDGWLLVFDVITSHGHQRLY